MTSGGGDQGGHPAGSATNNEHNENQYEELFQDILTFQDDLYGMFV